MVQVEESVQLAFLPEGGFVYENAEAVACVEATAPLDVAEQLPVCKPVERQFKIMRAGRAYGALPPPPAGFQLPAPKASLWDRLGCWWKRSVLRMCCQGEALELWDQEREFDRAVRHAMVVLEPKIEGHPEVLEEEIVVMDVHAINDGEVHRVPKLVASAVVALRMKLGLGAMDSSISGNVSLVRAESAKLLRSWGVRTKDAAAHLRDIERAFFADDTHYRVPNWRARACANSRFVRWALGGSSEYRYDC